MIMMADSEVNWAAMPLTGVFMAQDAPFVLVGAFKANPLRDICKALAMEDLSQDPRFADLQAQFANKKDLQKRLRERIAIRPRAFWLERLEAEDLLCAPVRDFRDVLCDTQTLHNGMLLEGTAAEVHFRFIGSPIGMSAAPIGMRLAPPRLGEHTCEVLPELGERRAP